MRETDNPVTRRRDEWTRGKRGAAPSVRAAFTLIEIRIVITILRIIATIVLPQFSTASNTARENMLKDELRYLRTQIVVYKAQHHDVNPGYPGGDTTKSATDTDYLQQMTLHT